MNNTINNLTNNPTNINNPINNPTNNLANSTTNILINTLNHNPAPQNQNHQLSTGHQHQVSNLGKILTAQHSQLCTTNSRPKKVNPNNRHTPPSKTIIREKDDSQYKIKQINFLNINVRGVKSKLDSLESLLTSNDIDRITETHLNGNEQIYIDGHQDRLVF